MLRLAVLGNDRDVEEYLKLAPRMRAASMARLTDVMELDRQGFDAVVLCPRDSQEADWRFVAARGHHLFLVKPPSTAELVTELLAECQTQDVCLMVGSSRYLPAVGAIKQSLVSGELGNLGLIRMHHWQPHLTDLLAEIDLAIWMFQTMPTEIYALAENESNKRSRYFQLHLGFPGGGMVLIDGATLPTSTKKYFSLSVIGATGAAYADDHHNQQLLFRGEQPISLTTGEGEVARLAELQEFVDALNQQRTPLVTGVDALQACLVFEAAHESVGRGTAARLVGDHYEC